MWFKKYFVSFLSFVVINAEKAAYCIPTFSLKRERTLGMLLKDVEQKCNSEVCENVVFVRTTQFIDVSVIKLTRTLFTKLLSF